MIKICCVTHNHSLFMRMVLLTTLLGALSAAYADSSQKVVLLHGMARSSDSMSKMERNLKEAGFVTCNVGYPSTQYAIDMLAKDHILPKVKECMGDQKAPVAFVTHSLGGVVVRQLRKADPDVPIGRVVMLGPPNHGSELADLMKSWILYQWVNGPAGQQLGTGLESVPNSLGQVDFELGVIAGNKPFLEPFKGYINGPNDGKVSVESTKIMGMKAHIVLPVTHATMMRNDDVIRQAVEFLRNGVFTGSDVPNKSPQVD